jgi:cobalt-zinc-cadmium resistance protein CzcA
MKIRYIKKMVLLILLFIPFISNSQIRKINLKEAIKIAIEKYPSVKSSKYNLVSNKMLLGSVYDFGTTSISTSKDETKSGIKGSETVFKISQSDIDIFGIFSKRRYVKSQIALAEAQLELTKIQIEYLVEKAYNNLLMQDKLLKIFKDLDKRYSGFVKAAQLRFSTKETSKLELLAAKAKRNEIKLQLKSLEGLIISAKADLIKYLQIKEPYILEDEVLNLGEINLSSNKSLKLSTAIVNKSRELLRVYKASLLPKLNFSYSKQNVAGIGGFYGYELGVSIPLFRGIRSKNRSLAYSLKSKEEDYNITKLEIESQLVKKRVKLYSLQKVVSYYKSTAVPLAKERMSASDLAYKIGEIDYVNYIQTIESGIRTLLDYITNDIMYRNIVAETHLLAGKSIIK